MGLSNCSTKVQRIKDSWLEWHRWPEHGVSTVSEDDPITWDKKMWLGCTCGETLTLTGNCRTDAVEVQSHRMSRKTLEELHSPSPKEFYELINSNGRSK